MLASAERLDENNSEWCRLPGGVNTNEKDQDKALLAFLTRGRSTDVTDHDTAATAQPSTDDDIEAFLRAMGYNRPERERIRRGPSRSRNDAKYRDAAPKRYAFYLSQSLPNLTSGEITRLAEAWVMLTDYNLDLAQRWWAAGIDPSHPEHLADAIEAGLELEHLGLDLNGRSVAEHLQAGSPLRWILGAMGLSTSMGDEPEKRRSA
jgi:hypothetical protein